MDHNENLEQHLQRIPWFMELKPDHLHQIASIARLEKIQAGEVLFAEGDTQTNLYVLLEGEISVEMQVPGSGCLQVFCAEPLDILGWSALTPVARQRTTTARALVPCRLISIDSRLLHQLCEDNHDLGYMIMRRLSNVVASRYLATRLALYDLLTQSKNSL